MLVQIATNRTAVVVAVEEPLGSDNLWLWLCGQLILQGFAFDVVHVVHSVWCE
jgi:hypothetical protein